MCKKCVCVHVRGTKSGTTGCRSRQGARRACRSAFVHARARSVSYPSVRASRELEITMLLGGGGSWWRRGGDGKPASVWMSLVVYVCARVSLCRVCVCEYPGM